MDQDQTPQPFAPLPCEAEALPALEGGDDLASRRCARCRVVFEDAPTVDIRGHGRREWSLCPPCQAIAFPKRSRSSAMLSIVRPLEADQDGSHPS